jgi:hypothetical protein
VVAGMPYISAGLGYVTKRIYRKNEVVGEDVTLGNHDLLNITVLVNISIHTCHITCNTCFFVRQTEVIYVTNTRKPATHFLLIPMILKKSKQTF